MRKKIIAANWKMNMTVTETANFLESFRPEVDEISAVEIVIAPPFTALPKLSELLGGSQKIRLGAQNFYFEKSGAYIGGNQRGDAAADLFVKYVIIGA
jgi:triosephosphate isomerase